MPKGKQLSVSQMESGQTGRVVQIDGGQGIVTRLSAMGIRPGRQITKISSMLMRGPVTIRSGSTQVAIGYGMARKIIVEPD
jgi:ferrous iron transport protein A